MRPLILHGAHEVSLRIIKINPGADRGDLELIHHDLAAMSFNGADDRVDSFHPDGAFEPGHPGSLHRLATLVQQALYSGVFLIHGVNQVEIRWPPGLEPPAKYLFIKPPGTVHIIGSDSKAPHVICHVRSIE